MLHPSPSPKQYLRRRIIYKNTRDVCDVAKLSEIKKKLLSSSAQKKKKKKKKKQVNVVKQIN